MKCPFCQQDLAKYYWNALECYACPDLACDGYYMTATKDVWRDLIRTRKALDKAIWWLNEIVENHRFTPISTAEKALAEINEIKGGKDE